MCHVNIFLPELLVQALRKRPERKLCRREGEGGSVTGGGASEEEGAALATPHRAPINRLSLEGGDRPARMQRAALKFVSSALLISSSRISRNNFQTS